LVTLTKNQEKNEYPLESQTHKTQIWGSEIDKSRPKHHFRRRAWLCYLHKIHSYLSLHVQQENIFILKGFKTQIEILKNSSHPYLKGITNQINTMFSSLW
jgi:hypothetical protein